MKKYFLLELHDVTPHVDREFAAMLDWACRFGAAEPLILCVPHWQLPQESSADRKAARRFYQKISSAKGEIVLHGLAHRARPSCWDRLWYGEAWGAEFKGVSAAVAARKLREGRSLLTEWTGRPIHWFCPPRWQQSRQTAAALQELNFKGYLSLRGVFVFPRTFLPLPVLSFDHGSRAWVNRLNWQIERHRLARLLHHQLPFRLALHPRDMDRPPVLRLLTEIHHHLTSAAYQPISLQKLLKPAPYERILKGSIGRIRICG